MDRKAVDSLGRSNVLKRGKRAEQKDYAWQMTKKAIDRRKAERLKDLDIYNQLCGPVTITYIDKN